MRPVVRLEDVNVGDEVYFETNAFSNGDIYWKVLEKDEHGLFLAVDEMGANDKRYVRISDVLLHQKANS